MPTRLENYDRFIHAQVRTCMHSVSVIYRTFHTYRQNVLITKCVPITLHNFSHKRDARRNDSRFHAHNQEIHKAFWMVNIKELACWEETGVNGITLNWILKKSNECGLNSSVRIRIVDACIHGNKPLCSIKWGEFLA